MNRRICSPFCSVKFPVEIPPLFLGHGYVSKRSQKMGTPESYAAYALEK